MARDYIRGDDFDLQFAHGDFKSGASLQQEVEEIVVLNQGELKAHPILGCNLTRLINTPVSRDKLNRSLRVNMERDNKDFEQIKNQIQLKK